MLPKPHRGETKEQYINRLTSNASSVDSPSVEDATTAWEVFVASHVGPSSSGECCSEKMLEVIKTNLADYTTSVRKYDGKDHLVVPCVMLQEGVHNGSAGKVLYLAEEIGKFPGAWNGVPVPIFHPVENGIPVSCNSPEILESWNSGRVFGAISLNGGKKLKADLWLDIARLQEMDPALLARLNKKENIEVSTGLFFDIENSPGVWNGEEYDMIARNFRPDHLAILPNGNGACSLKDGCGIRANASASYDYQKAWNRLVVMAELSFQDTMHSIRQQILEPMDKPPTATSPKYISHWLVEVWQKYFIYEVEQTGTPTQYFRQNYSIDKDGKVTLSDSPTEVTRKTTYTVKVNNSNGGRIKVNREEMIKFLIANGSPLSKEALETQTEEMLQYAVDTVTKLNETTTTINTLKETVTKLETEMKKPATLQDFLSQAPAEVCAVVNRAMAREEAERNGLITNLVKSQTIYPEAELRDMSTAQLEKLTALAAVNKPKDYSLRGTRTVDPLTTNEEEPMVVPTFNFAK